MSNMYLAIMKNSFKFVYHYENDGWLWRSNRLLLETQLWTASSYNVHVPTAHWKDSWFPNFLFIALLNQYLSLILRPYRVSEETYAIEDSDNTRKKESRGQAKKERKACKATQPKIFLTEKELRQVEPYGFWVWCTINWSTKAVKLGRPNF